MGKTDSVSVQIAELLDEYSEEVQRVTDEAIEDVADEAVQKLRSTSPVGASGRYAKGWTAKKEGSSRVVYNKTDARLTHLLENGHAIANQFGRYGRVAGIKHIEPVEQWANDELLARIERELQ